MRDPQVAMGFNIQMVESDLDDDWGVPPFWETCIWSLCFWRRAKHGIASSWANGKVWQSQIALHLIFGNSISGTGE